MKEPLRDRFDVLLEKAQSGDANAQYEVAKCFMDGHLVEPSRDWARYWAFKALCAGNMSAEALYKSIVQ